MHRRLNDVSLNKKHSAVFVYGSYVYAMAEGTARRERGRKEGARFSQVTSAKLLCLVLSFFSFLFSSALLSIRGCVSAASNRYKRLWGTPICIPSRVSMHIRTLGYLSRVVTYGDRYRVPLICHELQRLLLFVSFSLSLSLYFSLLSVISLSGYLRRLSRGVLSRPLSRR